MYLVTLPFISLLKEERGMEQGERSPLHLDKEERERGEGGRERERGGEGERG